jgi:hypothetical protein
METSTKAGKSGADVETHIAAISNDIAKLSDLLTQLLSDKVAETSGAAQDNIAEIARKGREAADHVKSAVQESTTSLEQAIVKQPFIAVLLALIIGLFAGSIMRR